MKYSQPAPCEYEDTPSQQTDDIAAYFQWIYISFFLFVDVNGGRGWCYQNIELKVFQNYLVNNNK